MNWRRGFFRVWVVVSALWIVGVLSWGQPWASISSLLQTSQTARFPGIPVDIDLLAPLPELPPLPDGFELSDESEGPWMKYQAARDAQRRMYADNILRVGITAFLPPLILLMLMGATTWAFLGFKGGS